MNRVLALTSTVIMTVLLLTGCSGGGGARQNADSDGTESLSTGSAIHTPTPAASPIPASPEVSSIPYLPIGDAEVFVTGWKRGPSQREGWLTVSVAGVAMNTRDGVRLNDLLGQDSETPDLAFETSLDSYTARIYGPPDVDRGYRDASANTRAVMPIPAGVGVVVEITGEVPQTADDIILSYGGTDIPYGETSPASLLGDDLPETLDLNVPCDIGRATISMSGFETHSATTLLNGNFVEQFAVFNVENSRGDDLNVRSDHLGPLFLLLLTDDGRSIVDDEYYYTDEIEDADLVPPGFTKRKYMNVSSTALDPAGIVDTSGATVVVAYSDPYQPTTPPEFCVWHQAVVGGASRTLERIGQTNGRSATPQPGVYPVGVTENGYGGGISVTLVSIEVLPDGQLRVHERVRNNRSSAARWVEGENEGYIMDESGNRYVPIGWGTPDGPQQLGNPVDIGIGQEIDVYILFPAPQDASETFSFTDGVEFSGLSIVP